MAYQFVEVSGKKGVRPECNEPFAASPAQIGGNRVPGLTAFDRIEGGSRQPVHYPRTERVCMCFL